MCHPTARRGGAGAGGRGPFSLRFLTGHPFTGVRIAQHALGQREVYSCTFLSKDAAPLNSHGAHTVLKPNNTLVYLSHTELTPDYDMPVKELSTILADVGSTWIRVLECNEPP
ncbi:hypothetical protein EVAR_54327_1 [Eumeta japonica]|uniref:Uncharacterized protein n=1 Tax=Eumeta variegata TaxID=151549 RepID=A0A4C1Y7E1_EUMVA|nr:hypothetical protein EVAR_54327_1 [Eumeta japonica]